MPTDNATKPDACCGSDPCATTQPAAATPAAPATPAPFEVVLKAADGLAQAQAKALERLERIETDFVARFKSDEKLQGAFDKLYVEMQQYKDDFVFQAQKPLLVDLVVLHDRMTEAIDKAEGAAKDALDTLREQLLEMLYRRDVEPMEFDPAEKFNRDRMKAIKREPAATPAEDLTVAKLLRQGFEWNKRVLRPHEVVVRRHGA